MIRFKLFFSLILFILILFASSAQITYSSLNVIYIITVPDLDGSYGFIVPLEGDRYTSFIVEKSGSVKTTMCTNYFVEQAKQLLALSLGSYVQCSAGVGEVYVDVPPQGETVVIPTTSLNITKYYAYVVKVAGTVVMPSGIAGDRVDITVRTSAGASGGGGGGGVFDFLGALRSFFNAVWQSISLLGQAISSAGQVFGAIAEGFKAIGVWIGKPGDPEAVMYYNLYRLQLLAMSDVPVVQEVLQCKKPISSALHLMSVNTSLKYTDKTLCEIENAQPQGVIGMMQMLFTTVLFARSFLVFIFQNFILINIAVISAVLLYGAYRSITTKKIDEVMNSFTIIYKIFHFYWSIIKFIAETIWRIIQMIAEFIQAILPF